MATQPMQHFEIPPDMRKFAEQSVEQARKAFDGFISAAHQAVNDFEGRAKAAQAGAKDVGGQAMAFAERNVAASFDFAQKLVRAKDVEEIMRLQGEYVKAQMQALNDQAQELGRWRPRSADTATPHKPQCRLIRWNRAKSPKKHWLYVRSQYFYCDRTIESVI